MADLNLHFTISARCGRAKSSHQVRVIFLSTNQQDVLTESSVSSSLCLVNRPSGDVRAVSYPPRALTG